MVHPLDLPKSIKITKIQDPKSPKSKIQNHQDPKSKIPQIQKPKSKIPKIQNPKSPESKIQNPQILDFGDLGFWILDRYVAILYVKPPTPQILEFRGGFWILDFGDFGFWGFWILGILDFKGRNPKPKILQSKIQKPKKFGFWILDWTVM